MECHTGAKNGLELAAIPCLSLPGDTITSMSHNIELFYVLLPGREDDFLCLFLLLRQCLILKPKMVLNLL